MVGGFSLEGVSSVSVTVPAVRSLPVACSTASFISSETTQQNMFCAAAGNLNEISFDTETPKLMF